MPLVDDLLEQADHLANRDAARPRQANLRRAVSSGYYAIFHEIIDTAVVHVMPAARARGPIGHRLRRIIQHKQILTVASWYSTSSPQGMPAGVRILRTVGVDVPADLVAICDVFVDMQNARHRADYDLSKSFSRLEANRLIGDAARAVHLLRGLPISEDRDLFLYACLFGAEFAKAR